MLLLVRTFLWGTRELTRLDNGLTPLETGLAAKLFVASPIRVKAIGGEGIAKGVDPSSLVVVAAHSPVCFVPVTGIGPANPRYVWRPAERWRVSRDSIPDLDLRQRLR